MALILPPTYHKITAVERNRISWIEPKEAERQDIRPLRIGILNIMPLGKQYEFNLLHPLGLSVLQIEPIWIRLQNHAYRSWDQSHLNELYVSWEDALAQGPLDGLIITGAPVEHLPFEEVTYWRELVGLIEEARSICASTLGLCWAGFALAYLAGVDKEPFNRKLFGVYPMRSLVPGHSLMGTQDDQFFCPQSRHAAYRTRRWNQRNGRENCACWPMASLSVTPFSKHPIRVTDASRTLSTTSAASSRKWRETRPGVMCRLQKTSTQITRGLSGGPIAISAPAMALVLLSASFAGLSTPNL